MSGRIHSVAGRLGWPLAASGAYLVSAYFSLHIAKWLGGVAAIWPASGVVVAALLLSVPGRRVPMLAGLTIASWFANMISGWAVLPALQFTTANMVEGVVTVALFLRGGEGISFAKPDNVLRFCAAAIAGSAVGTFTAMLLTANFSQDFMWMWFATVLLGQLIVTPLIATIAWGVRERREHLELRGFLAGGAIMVVLLATCVLVFSQNRYPLLFLPPALVILATYRLGMMGAAVSVSLVALVGLLAMVNGTGPIHFIAGSQTERILFFQFFLLTQLASAVPLAALLMQRDHMLFRISRVKALLEMAERAAHVGHWRLDLRDNSLFWSKEVFHIHGLSGTERPALEEAINAYHEDDRDLVQNSIAQSLESGEEFYFLARIVRPDGTIRYVESRGQPQLDDFGRKIALFGVFQDVTDQVSTLMELEEARSQAEEDALAAQILAETDQLTGPANRRKIMASFTEEFARAKAGGGALTIAILDVDRFKAINDTYGHGFGDSVLQALAESCQATLRQSDHVGRLGGEEFMLVFPDTPIRAAELIAERLRANVEALRWQEQKGFSMTVSIGLATMHGSEDHTSLMRAADKALYDAKNDGRNCLKIAA